MTIIGGFTDAFHFYPVIVRGNIATIYPHNDLLTYGRTYYVQIDPGVLTLPDGGFTGVRGKRGWTFSTKPRRAGGRCDAPRGGGRRNGGLQHGPGRARLRAGPESAARDHPHSQRRLRGDRLRPQQEQHHARSARIATRVQIHYANSEIFNPHPSNVATNEWPGTFPSRRAAFMADQASGVHFVNLTIRNTARGQAEGLLLTGERNIVSHASIYGSGDALQVNGSAYITDSLIAGDGDTILGRGPAFFTNCELQSRGPFTWTRNTAANHGNVFLELPLQGHGRSAHGDRARAGQRRPHLSRTWKSCCINSALDGISPVGWGDVGGDTSQAHYWEYNSTNLRDGSPVDISARHPVSKRLTKERGCADDRELQQSRVGARRLEPGDGADHPEPARRRSRRGKGQAAELSVTVAAVPDGRVSVVQEGCADSRRERKDAGVHGGSGLRRRAPTR